MCYCCFFFQAEDGIRDRSPSRGLGDVYKRQSNMFFILRKVYAPEERRILLKSLCTLFEVESIDKRKIERALLNKEFSDFEDCLQMECALSFGADYIVSRNPKDFQNSKVPCIDPKELVVKEHI